jgi:hypothetical protein
MPVAVRQSPQLKEIGRTSIQPSSALRAGELLQTFSTSESAFHVLFVGDNRSAFASPANFLERRGAQCSFSNSPGQALANFGREAFRLILDMTPFQADHFALLALGSSRCNIFRFCQLEVGSLWIPVMRDGQECFGSAALRPKEFVDTLERMVAESEYRVRAACG